MATSFDFATTGRIVFGAGTLNQLATIGRDAGRHALLVTGRNLGRAERTAGLLRNAGCHVTFFQVGHEPTTGDIERGLRSARDAGCDCVVAFGGGSAIDAGKAIAALLTNSGALMDYLEVIGRGQPLDQPSAPCIAIPTTAGTGAEATRNAVLASPPHRVKVSLRSRHMLPRVAIVDPELTYDLPPALTAATGLDAFTQLLEPFVSTRANPMTDPLCIDGLARIARSLRRAVLDGHDAAAREDMALASLFGGIALANAGLGAVHGIAGPLGGAFPAPHGAVCAALLPSATAVNVRALRARARDAAALGRYERVARIVSDDPHASAEDLASWLREFVEKLQIPPLRAYGVTSLEVPAIVAAAAKASSMKANPIVLTADECAEILCAALE